MKIVEDSFFMCYDIYSECQKEYDIHCLAGQPTYAGILKIANARYKLFAMYKTDPVLLLKVQTYKHDIRGGYNMKKAKRILTAIAASAMMAAGSVCAGAYPGVFPLYYEAGSEEYAECISDMTQVPYEEKLGALLNAGIDQKWHSVYYAPGRNDEAFKGDKISDIRYGSANEYMIEIDDPNNDTEKDRRRFIGLELYFNQLYEMDGKGGELSNSLESINAFLKENGYDAEVELNSLNKDWIDRLYITYGEDVDTEEMVDILYSLYREFELEPFTYGTFGSLVVAGAALNSAGEEDMLFGDANGDGKFNVRDCAFIAGSLAKGDGEKLPPVADYNLDSKKNIRDAAAISKDLASK